MYESINLGDFNIEHLLFCFFFLIIKLKNKLVLGLNKKNRSKKLLHYYKNKSLFYN